MGKAFELKRERNSDARELVTHGLRSWHATERRGGCTLPWAAAWRRAGGRHYRSNSQLVCVKSRENEVRMKLDRIEGKPDDKVAWGSDIAAQMLRRFGIPFISLNPGASYRGFHDSLVNHLGNENPGIILCLHEDHSVAIAHGYAKATGEPMACVLHSNVGLLHGMMGIFNAWCDRAPMLMLSSEERRVGKECRNRQAPDR